MGTFIFGYVQQSMKSRSMSANYNTSVAEMIPDVNLMEFLYKLSYIFGYVQQSPRNSRNMIAKKYDGVTEPKK